MPLQLHFTPASSLPQLDPIYDLTAKAFSGHHNHWDWLRLCRAGYFEPSHYDREASMLAYLGDTLVAHVGIWDFRIRLGDVEARCAGVGAVATHGEFRGQKVMDRTMRQCLERLPTLGYDLTLLFGIWGFYSRFGYTPVWPESTHIAKPSQVRRHSPTTTREPVEAIHGPDFAPLHAAANAGLSGSAVRPTYPGPLPFDTGPRAVLKSADGALVGALQIKPERDHLCVLEALGDPAEALEHACRLAEEHKVDELRFRRLHPRSALAARLEADYCRVEQHHHRDGWAMALLLRPTEVLQRALPALATRVRALRPEGLPTPLVLADGRRAHRLTITAQAADIEVVSLDSVATAPDLIRAPDGIVRLLFGSERVAQEAIAGRLELRGAGQAWASVLFPEREPMLNALDFF